MQICPDTTASVILARYAYAYLCIYLQFGTRELEMCHWINIRCSRPVFLPKKDLSRCTLLHEHRD